MVFMLLCYAYILLQFLCDFTANPLFAKYLAGLRVANGNFCFSWDVLVLNN